MLLLVINIQQYIVSNNMVVHLEVNTFYNVTSNKASLLHLVNSTLINDVLTAYIDTPQIVVVQLNKPGIK